MQLLCHHANGPCILCTPSRIEEAARPAADWGTICPNWSTEDLNDTRRLRINAGYCSRQGKREENQDFLAIHIDAASGARGDVAAIADGVSYGKAGRIAAELAVREFLEAHHALSPTGGVQRNAGRALQSINSWLHGMAARDPAMQH
ncbi:MAG TPA: PP2C family serine/threonine-protein phosphatase, partial [Steroidobacteraceae bacterium]|nr:PP2C family serine/threonine-protein phosphatase [Steroidobacteraceae bacterium]